MQRLLARRKAAAAALSVGPAAVGLGLAAHVVSGGTAPPVTVLVALTAITSLLAAAAAHLQLPPWAIGCGSGALQQALHLLFTALTGATAPLLPSVGHVHGHGPSAPGSGVLTAGSGAAVDLHLVVVAHLAAALLTVGVALAANRLPDRWGAHPSRVQPSPSAA
jgi:hypothetical protein